MTKTESVLSKFSCKRNVRVSFVSNQFHREMKLNVSLGLQTANRLVSGIKALYHKDSKNKRGNHSLLFFAIFSAKSEGR